MRWCKSNRADPIARRLADRHYNRQKIGSKQFVPPGSCCVFITDCANAFWVTSVPYAKYVLHAWAGAWVCSAFRSENAGTASILIQEAVAATLAHYKKAPELGLVTFIDTKKVKPIMVHGAKTWGYTWLKAGFEAVGETKSGLLVFQLRPINMPFPEPAKPRPNFESWIGLV